MDAYGTYKFSDAVDQPLSEEESVNDTKVEMTHETAAEQVREARESAEAKNAEASNRQRMVNIGRGNQQAGRQGQ